MTQHSYNPIMAVALLVFLTWSLAMTTLTAQDVQKTEMYKTINARQQTSWETANRYGIGQNPVIKKPRAVRY